jgi:hypothetical protein
MATFASVWCHSAIIFKFSWEKGTGPQRARVHVVAISQAHSHDRHTTQTLHSERTHHILELALKAKTPVTSTPLQWWSLTFCICQREVMTAAHICTKRYLAEGLGVVPFGQPSKARHEPPFWDVYRDSWEGKLNAAADSKPG